MTIQDALDVELGPDQGSLSVMDDTGDTRMIWNRSNTLEVELARDAFNKARGRGYAAYSVEGSEGRKGTVISEFDPQAERIILAPPLAGGA